MIETAAIYISNWTIDGNEAKDEQVQIYRN
jgi:hypothetical protein